MIFNFAKGSTPGCFSGGVFGFSLSYGWNITKKWSL